MTVKELIEELKNMPHDSNVRIIFNDTEGELINIIYEQGNKTVWLDGEVN